MPSARKRAKRIVEILRSHDERHVPMENRAYGVASGSLDLTVKIPYCGIDERELFMRAANISARKWKAEMPMWKTFGTDVDRTATRWEGLWRYVLEYYR